MESKINEALLQFAHLNQRDSGRATHTTNLNGVTAGSERRHDSGVDRSGVGPSRFRTLVPYMPSAGFVKRLYP